MPDLDLHPSRAAAVPSAATRLPDRRAYALVTFVGAALLFLVQPLIAKAILPWFGGVPAVWATSLVFYQTVLLAGYAYAHATARLPRPRQGWLHAGMLAVSLAWLPILPAAAWKPAGALAPAWHVLALLAATVGVPYLVLSATSPLLHDWYGRAGGGRAAYRLYAVSNAGSLVGLLLYPFVLEPLLGVRAQALAWSAAYLPFAAACAALSLRRRAPGAGAMEDSAVSAPGAEAAGMSAAGASPERQATPAAAEPSAPAAGVPAAERALWFALAACGSGLLLATTNAITMEIAAVPLLWVLPLVLYLLSYIGAFGGAYRRLLWAPLLPPGLFVMALILKSGPAVPILKQVVAASLVLLVACMVVHGELARRAPAPARLTSFYLTISAGGAVGGALVALGAPLVFPDFWELPLFLLLSWALLLAALFMDPESRFRRGPRRLAWAPLLAILVLAGAAFAVPLERRARGSIASARDFYGQLRVLEMGRGTRWAARILMHGNILHGGQILDPARRNLPTAYYAPGSGVALAIREHPARAAGRPLRIGVIGLGTGTIAALTSPGDTLRFWEIDPEVERFARRYFTYLRDSPASTDVVLGDGRLSLERGDGRAGQPAPLRCRGRGRLLGRRHPRPPAYP